MIQSTLIFYASSRGFGTSITLLEDEHRLDQIQAVSLRSPGQLQETNQSVNCNKRCICACHRLPLQMLRPRNLPASHASKTTQQSVMGYVGLVYRVASSRDIHVAGEL